MAPQRSTGFVFLFHPSEPMIDDTIKLFIKGSLRDKRHHPCKIVFLTGKTTECVTRINKSDDSVARLLKPSGKPSPKRDLSPVVGAYLCEHVSHCHSEFSAGPFFPRTARSSFPPNPKGLRGRAMTKVHATDGKRSLVLLLIAEP